jgi:hypothetical protein
MLLDDLADHLSANGFGTVYKDYFPPTPDTVTTIYNTGGSAPVHVMGGSVVLEQPRIKVVCRSANQLTAQQLAKGAYEVLDGMRDQVINGITYYWCQAVQEPFVMGRDQNARFVVACDFDVKKQRST